MGKCLHALARVALIVLIRLPSSSWSEEPPDLDTSVSSVVSGGYWEHETQRGHYRIVVRSAGWEHVSSTIRVEWIVEDPGKQQNRLLASSPVGSIPDWAWSLATPHLTCTAPPPRQGERARARLANVRCQFTIEG